MKVKQFAPESITINPELRARKGPPDPEAVSRIAESIASHGQLQPGIVREEGSKNILIAGEHRLAATILLNGLLAAGEEPYKFSAVVVKADDEKSLVDAIVENEYRQATDIFDRAVAMQRLADMGKSQADIAKTFGVSEATVTQTLKAGKLPAKYQKAVRNGDMTQDAALMIAEIEDKKEQQEVLELALKFRSDMDAYEARIAERQAEAAAEEAEEAEGEEGEEEAEEAEAETPKKKGKKPAAKKGRKPTKGKVTKEDVARAKKEKNIASAPAPVSKKAFIVAMEAISSDKENPVSKSVKDLMGRIEGFLDGDYTITQLRNSFVKNCLPN